MRLHPDIELVGVVAGGAQVVKRARITGEHLGLAELEQDLCALRGFGRLGQRSRQVLDRRVGRPPRERVVAAVLRSATAAGSACRLQSSSWAATRSVGAACSRRTRAALA